jgi:predicted nucleic acid-binding protein
VAAPDKAFFDTNVLVYLFDLDAPEKRRRALELVESHRFAASFVISAQVLLEFYSVVTRKGSKTLSPDRARREVESLAESHVVPVDGQLALRAVERSRASRLSVWDATIVEAALLAGCTTLFTEDLQDGWVVDGKLKVVNPFA